MVLRVQRPRYIKYTNDFSKILASENLSTLKLEILAGAKEQHQLFASATKESFNLDI